ncbi:hypothetical protein [Actinomycetospora atypica]|uniref:Uncharacterized protein n=1 Tax=Actinomycetospora atypica TaxID=1290095 RepID=A0ABV9YWI0_9PSEU
MQDTDVDLTVDEELPGRAIDPDLLALIQRVAHREHLLSGNDVAARTDNALTRPGRRRPTVGSSARRTTRGTTARKVTWSR